MFGIPGCELGERARQFQPGRQSQILEGTPQKALLHKKPHLVQHEPKRFHHALKNGSLSKPQIINSQFAKYNTLF